MIHPALTLAIGLLTADIVFGQNILKDPQKIADARNFFATLEGKPAACEILPVKPHFLFSLRLEAGYVVRMPKPLQLQAQNHKWILLTSITPQDNDSAPTYLAEIAQFSNSALPEPEITGSYWLGEGRYAVKFLMFDAHGDVCRKDWQIDARLDPGTNKLKMILPAGTVGGRAGTAPVSTTASPQLNRVTILLHAASARQLQTVLSKLDKAMLLDGLVAFTEELPARSVRLVVFNLEQRKELFRQDNFTVASLPQVAKVLDAVQSSVVDYHALQNPHGTVDFIESLLNQEMRAAEPSEGVILLGPRSIFKDKPSPQFVLAQGTKPHFFYLVCEPTHVPPARSLTSSASSWGLENLAMGVPQFFAAGMAEAQNTTTYDHGWTNYGPNQGRDSLEYAVSQLSGKTLHADSVDTFTKAIAAIARQLGKSD
jgi:hypothetical protein